jgi:hypothetical protein
MFHTKVVEKIKTHFVFGNFFLENRAVCEIMWKNIVERGRSHMTIRRMRIACWILKATNTHSQYVMLIACPLQQWLHERTSMLRHTYITCPPPPTINLPVTSILLIYNNNIFTSICHYLERIHCLCCCAFLCVQSLKNSLWFN